MGYSDLLTNKIIQTQYIKQNILNKINVSLRRLGGGVDTCVIMLRVVQAPTPLICMPSGGQEDKYRNLRRHIDTLCRIFMLITGVTPHLEPSTMRRNSDMSGAIDRAMMITISGNALTGTALGISAIITSMKSTHESIQGLVLG